MNNKILIAVALILPLMQACDRSERSPGTTGARTPSAQDRMLESAPPAAGVPATPNSPAGETSNSPSSSSSSTGTGSGSAPGSTGNSPGTNQSGDTRR